MPPQLPAADADGHLPLPLLRQYVAGVLPATEEHLVEAHTLTCARCADVLDGLSASDAPTTDAAMQELHSRLHQRLAQETAPRRAAGAWRAVAAVVLLLVLSTAAWLGLRPGPPRPEAAEVAVAPSAPQPMAPPAAPKMSEPVAVQSPALVMAESAPAAPARAARPSRLLRRSARRPDAAAPASADVAAVMTEVAPPAAPAAEPAAVASAPAATRAASPAVADSTTMPNLAQGNLAKAKMAVREEALDHKAKLPPAVTISPQPVGGYRALREYLHRENAFVPEPPAKAVEGTVWLKFTVTAAGKLENFRITKGIRPDYDAEAIRLICEGPAWQPGAANGRRADQIVEMPVPF